MKMTAWSNPVQSVLFPATDECDGYVHTGYVCGAHIQTEIFCPEARKSSFQNGGIGKLSSTAGTRKLKMNT